MSDTKIKLKCMKCGSNQFKVPSDPQPDDMISCAGCDVVIGRYDEVQAATVKLGKEAIEKELREMLKKAGFK